jgi:hypothetical protein
LGASEIGIAMCIFFTVGGACCGTCAGMAGGGGPTEFLGFGGIIACCNRFAQIIVMIVILTTNVQQLKQANKHNIGVA